jgi:predicted RNA-binding protein with RPS1 domain
VRNFGAFVDLGGADGMILISELAWHRVNNPKEVIIVGDDVMLFVLSLDKEVQRIALSRKRLLQNPWDTAEERYKINQTVEGKVTRIVTYGAFVEIEPGVEGLLHISQLSRDNVEDPNDLLKEGETHLLRVVSVDANRQRIGLSLKSVTAEEQIAWMSQREAAEPEEPEPEDDTPSAEAEIETAETEPETPAEEAPEASAEVEDTDEADETESAETDSAAEDEPSEETESTEESETSEEPEEEPDSGESTEEQPE